MADWSLPATTSTYVNVLANLKDRDLDSAKLFDGVTVTNPATGTPMATFSLSASRIPVAATAWVKGLAAGATGGVSACGNSFSPCLRMTAAIAATPAMAPRIVV